MQKHVDITDKALEIAAKFVGDDTQNAFSIIQGGMKGTAKWCGAQAVLPYLVAKEAKGNKHADKHADHKHADHHKHAGGLTPTQVLFSERDEHTRLYAYRNSHLHFSPVGRLPPPPPPCVCVCVCVCLSMQEHAWTVFTGITAVVASLQPDEAKRTDLETQYLTGGGPLALLLGFIGADTEDYSPEGL